MRNAIIFFILLLTISCKKTTVQDTTLTVSVKDALNNIMSGATVTLYTSQDDMDKKANAVAIKTADSKGLLTFTGLRPVQYFFFAETGCSNNAFTPKNTTGSIAAGIENHFYLTVGKTGFLRFTNNSSNTYRIFLNGVSYYDLPGNTWIQSGYAQTADYSIRVLQLTGYSSAPIDKTYTGSLTCGAVLSTTFPN